MSAYGEGYEAYENGGDESDNPYPYDSHDADAWEDGFETARYEANRWDDYCDCSACRPDLYDEDSEELP